MLKLYTYQLPFSSEFKTSKEAFDVRKGAVITFEKDGITAFGEVAPLPGFSNEIIDECISEIEKSKKLICEGILSSNQNEHFHEYYKGFQLPSLKFGLDTLRYDFEAKKKGVSLHKLLFPNTVFEPIPINEVIGFTSVVKALKKTEQLVNAGFKTLKVKVGRDSELELEILHTISNKYKDLKIRIDANESWNLNTASKFLEKLKSVDLEYVEEPLNSSNFDQIHQLKKSTSINFALDEKIGNKNDLLKVTDISSFSEAIIKPMLIGSFSDIYVTINHLNSHDIRTVFTTSLESIIGRTITAILTMGWGAKEYAHGLSTGSMLKYDLSDHKEIENGFYNLPEGPGLGLNLNYNHLNRIL